MHIFNLIVTAKLLSKAVLIYPPTSILRELLFPKILANVVGIFNKKFFEEKIILFH